MFQHHFAVQGWDVNEHARHYLSGLLGTERRKNIGRIGEDVLASNYQGMQQLVTDSPWSHAQLVEQVAREASACMGPANETAFCLDETSFVKKGTASVGVQRQHCGRLGKLENCQVAVFGCLSHGSKTALVDFRLFLPQSWIDDPERCEKAKVPVEQRVHRTKAELALEMVKAARERGVKFGWILGDEVYGNNRTLTEALDAMGERFVMDVACNLKVWDQNPHPAAVSSGRTVRGRPRTRLNASNPQARQLTVKALTTENFETHGRSMLLRSTTKGPLRAQVWVKEIWLWNQSEQLVTHRLLVVRQDAEGDFKYSLSTASNETSWEVLAYQQAQRFWVERAFQDAKSELGMAQYEVRGWRAWHHHMALVCLAHLFILKERKAAAKNYPLLSARDIVELLDIYLPRRSRDPDEVLRNLQLRHQQRIRAMKSHSKSAKKSLTK